MTKEYILNEIKRTAKQNYGKPLGLVKFEKATDIKYSDWFGKIWAKWGDALVEAGFEPNKLNESYEENFLLSKLVEFIREIGHFLVSFFLKASLFTHLHYYYESSVATLRSGFNNSYHQRSISLFIFQQFPFSKTLPIVFDLKNFSSALLRVSYVRFLQ